MLQKMINFLRGSVRVEVAGPFPERFLNLCAQRSIAFWGVEWLPGGGLRLVVAGRDFRQLSPLGEKVMCTVRVAETGGVPFFLGRFRRRYAFLLGLALSLSAVCVLSQFILTVDVIGNETVPTAEIITQLRSVGVRLGAYGPGISVDLATREALLKLEDLSWMAINLHGTRAEILVRERVPKPAVTNERILGDVIAEAPGIITHMEVLEGEPMYVEGDTVTAGEIVISGNIKMSGPEYSAVPDRWRQVGASGRVYARTWRSLTAKIPLSTWVKTYTGQEKFWFSLHFLGNRINFYGNSGISFEQYDKISRTWALTLPGGQEMPLSLERESVRAYTETPTPIDQNAAEALLKTQLEAAMTAALGDGEIQSQAYTTLVRDGMLTVIMNAECTEEIGKFSPFPAEQQAPVETGA